MREHMFRHFPDICGFACPVCRKTAKRRKDLVEHMMNVHSTQVLTLYGIKDMKEYAEKFDSNSEEQIGLR